MDDGSEIAVPSLEALARRIDRGEILPDTELYDAGTGEWAAASRAAVVRFILEERELEGFDPLEAWEGVFDEAEAEASPADEVEDEQEVADAEEAPEHVGAVTDDAEEAAEPVGEVRDEVEEVADEEESEDEAEDPFDLGLTLEPGPLGGGEGASGKDSGEGGAADPLDEPAHEGGDADAGSGPTEFESFSLGEDFGATDEEDPDEADPDEAEAPAAGAPEPPRAGMDDPDALPLLEFPDEDDDPAPAGSGASGGFDSGPGSSDLGGGTSLDEWAAPPSAGKSSAPGEPLPGPPSRPVADPPRRKPKPAPRPTAPRPKKAGAAAPGKGRRRMVVALVVVGALAAGVFAFGDRIPLGDRDRDARADGEAGEAATAATASPALVGEDLAGVADVPPVPDGLEPVVDRALRAVQVRFDTVVDSLRAVHGMGEQPPREWLSGPYVAQASEFPSVRAFWTGYEQLVAELRSRDPQLFLETAMRAVSGPDPERNSAAERYLEARYRSVVQLRRARYAQLTVVARRAMELHEFLEASEAQIRFTPAIGPEVPLDPILEARSENPEVQRELLRRLDSLFEALDQTRGDDQPALGGLGNDLFRRFAEG